MTKYEEGIDYYIDPQNGEKIWINKKAEAENKRNRLPLYDTFKLTEKEAEKVIDVLETYAEEWRHDEDTSDIDVIITNLREQYKKHKKVHA